MLGKGFLVFNTLQNARNDTEKDAYFNNRGNNISQYLLRRALKKEKKFCAIYLRFLRTIAATITTAITTAAAIATYVVVRFGSDGDGASLGATVGVGDVVGVGTLGVVISGVGAGIDGAGVTT